MYGRPVHACLVLVFLALYWTNAWRTWEFRPPIWLSFRWIAASWALLALLDVLGVR